LFPPAGPENEGEDDSGFLERAPPIGRSSPGLKLPAANLLGGGAAASASGPALAPPGADPSLRLVNRFWISLRKFPPEADGAFSKTGAFAGGSIGDAGAASALAPAET
jgi:hypothetical protein